MATTFQNLEIFQDKAKSKDEQNVISLGEKKVWRDKGHQKRYTIIVTSHHTLVEILVRFSYYFPPVS